MDKKVNVKKYCGKIISVAIIIFLCIGLYYSFVINGAKGIKSALSENLILCNVYYITQIFASLAVVIAGIFAAWQYFITSRAERVRLNTDCIQRAINLAEYYKNNILEKYIVVQYVYHRCGIYDIVNKIDRDKIIEFDKTELNNLLSIADQEKIKEIRESDEFMEAVIEADKIYNLGFKFEQAAKVIKNEEGVVVSIKKGIILQKFMGNIVTEILNNMEFFAMHFTHKTADESVVYQSLHQTYLKIIYSLYYNIAILNDIQDLDESKYYTNAIDLYKTWITVEKKEKEAKCNAIRGHILKGNVAQKI